MDPIEREIRYESDRDPTFADEIRAMPGCELMDRCIQCATCSGICPMSDAMELTPRRIIELTRNGFKNDVLRANTIWLCTSCYQCQVECPKKIGITDIMYALKSKAIESGAYGKKFTIPILAREFYAMVKANGRVSESRLVQRLFMKTQPTRFLGMGRLGMKLMKTGRFSNKVERMRNPEGLRRALEALPTDGRKRS
ncbi:MAG: 4Fe-4S dicluster domain-containing protein [Fimbriimonadaceae bacterium]|nr:4Fe-4S dicluster domain-containing protein [Fimbriimonadaceae bacterium]